MEWNIYLRKSFPKMGADFPEGATVSVLTTRPLDGCLDYLSPKGGVSSGCFVEVPLGRSSTMGVVWGAGEGQVDKSKLRRITRVLEAPPLREDMQKFLRIAADYTVTPLPAMLRLATRAPGIGEPPKTRTVYKLTGIAPDRTTEARRRVLDALGNGAELGIMEISSRSGSSASVVKGLERQGVLRRAEVRDEDPPQEFDLDRKSAELTEDQIVAVRALKRSVAENRFATTLLKGVTGSGKTEVYLEAVDEALRAGRQVLVLLPEIALTSQFIERVSERFGCKPGEWHYGTTQAERRRLWHSTADGRVRLVVGARSALFLPFGNLGLIVVDEEHDASYKQDDGVLYNARDMAILRASVCGAFAVLSSATPSLETWVNSGSGKYSRVDLRERFGTATLPNISAIDMRGEKLPSGRWISSALALEVNKRISRGEQALLFLNKRGYAPITLCRECGHQLGCKDCDARLVEHRFRSRLMCHQCGATTQLPKSCPNCQATGCLTAVGPGVERLAEEAAMLFEGARIEILSSDLAGTSRDLSEKIEIIKRGQADIVIGTQLVAKGHNFPLLTLVGAIDTDIGLHGSDLRAAERTFQLMKQVSGRAGRVDRQGVALLQTWQPDHPVIQAILSGDDEGFWSAEAAERRVAGAPPFGRYAGIVISGPNANAVIDMAQAMVRNAAPLLRIGAQIFGPAPAPIARVRGRVRYRILVKADRNAKLQPALRNWARQFRIPANVRLSIDIDPQRFL